MATITENLQTIYDCRVDIKQAIINKGGEVGDLTTYAEAITNLPSGGGGDSSQLNFDGVSEDYEILCPQRMEKMIVKEGVKSIGDVYTGIGALSMYGWDCLSEMKISNTVEVIAPTGFEMCSNLTHLTLPNSVKRITSYAFESSYLQSIIMPNALESIEADGSFRYSDINFIYFNQAESIPTINGWNFIFTGFLGTGEFIPSTAKIIVPDNLYDEWRNADGWSYIAEQIYKASEYPLPTE